MGITCHAWKEQIAKTISLVSVTVGEAGVETRVGFLGKNITPSSHESTALRPATLAEVSQLRRKLSKCNFIASNVRQKIADISGSRENFYSS